MVLMIYLFIVILKLSNQLNNTSINISGLDIIHLKLFAEVPYHENNLKTNTLKTILKARNLLSRFS